MRLLMDPLSKLVGGVMVMLISLNSYIYSYFNVSILKKNNLNLDDNPANHGVSRGMLPPHPCLHLPSFTFAVSIIYFFLFFFILYYITQKWIIVLICFASSVGRCKSTFLRWYALKKLRGDCPMPQR